MVNAGLPGIETDLARLFAPRSVALVGASDNPVRFATRVFRRLLSFGYSGRTYPVNPRLSEIHVLKCFRDDFHRRYRRPAPGAG